MSDFRLRVFISVARNLSFTKASNELHISQPAISRHIHELEEQYHTSLFNREGISISLTPAGELLLSHALRISEDYQLLEFEMNQLNQSFAGELKIGASTTISQYVIPSLISLFFKRYPDIKINLLSGNSEHIEKALHEKRIDIGFVEGNHIDSSLHYSDFLDDEVVLITNANGKYRELDEVSPERLCTLPLVLREPGSGTLEVIENALSSVSVSLSSMNIILNLGSTESIKNFILQTDTLALVSIRSVLREIKAGVFKIIDITGLDITRKLRFVSNLGGLNPLVERFIEFAKSHKDLL